MEGCIITLIYFMFTLPHHRIYIWLTPKSIYRYILIYMTNFKEWHKKINIVTYTKFSRDGISLLRYSKAVFTWAFTERTDFLKLYHWDPKWNFILGSQFIPSEMKIYLNTTPSKSYVIMISVIKFNRHCNPPSSIS